MDINNRGKGKETEKVADEASTSITGTSHYKQYILINNYTPISDEPKIKLGATYDPNILPDHHGEYFQHPKATSSNKTTVMLTRTSFPHGKLMMH